MANNGTNGNELWITNGTATGTTMVKDINLGTKSSVSSNNLSYFYTNLGLYFPATNGTNGVEFWLSNGTSTGTKMIKDINVGATVHHLPLSLSSIITCYLPLMMVITQHAKQTFSCLMSRWILCHLLQ
jgi:ELWxxDGT repeat protein